MPLLGPTMEGRNQVFQTLKPPSVALSQAALALNGPKGDVQAVAQNLQDLEAAICSVTSRPDNLDEKLADYVFFPLSQVLKVSQKVSVRCLELALECLTHLIEHGWRGKIQPQLAAQVLILCTLMAEESPKGLVSAESTDELRCNAIRCLFHLFEVAGASPPTVEILVAESNIPQLGQTISTTLAAVTNGRSTEVQIVAVRTLQALIANVATIDIQAGFLPGVVSALTKVLTPQTKQRRNHRVLAGALDILCHMFKNILGDSTPSISSAASREIKIKPGNKTSKVVDQAWLETAASQIRPAITHITRLQTHDRVDVREALSRFCFTVLSCRHALANCTSLCLEALLSMASDPEASSIKAALEALVNAEPSMNSELQRLSHEWAQSLPTKMQSADGHAKIQHVQRLSIAYSVAASVGADMDMIERALANLLRDSAVITLQSTPWNQPAANSSSIQALELTVSGTNEARKEFSPLLSKHKGDSDVMLAISRFAQSITTSSPSAMFSMELARGLRQNHGDSLIASFWLLFDATKAAIRNDTASVSLLNIGDDASETGMAVLEDLYTFSLEILGTNADVPLDPRLQSLALRVLALRAEIAGIDFRYELIDALYPALHTLATPQEDLQQDSIITLNTIASACNYDSVRDLIVENVDYLTNAVALKLNAFDVSPQAPQVLLMMVRLAGPSLLPYLEDTVDSIFAALEDFHGYPVLVELLFRVLSVLSEEGAKAPQLAITNEANEAASAIRKEARQPSDISSLAYTLTSWAEDESSDEIHRHRELEPHPKRPWKDPESPGEVDESDIDEEPDESDQVTQALDTTDAPPPLPKTYNLLLKISDLTQHYLPSASASLRASLLKLVKTTIPAIARHENSFLPLINTLWPEVVARLDDSEHYIVAMALDIVALLCDHAGDFMRTRITQLWPSLVDLVNKTGKDIINVIFASSRKEGSSVLMPGNSQLHRALQRMRSEPASYSDTSTRLLWESEVKALSAIVRYVPLVPQMFDDALEMLEPVLDDKDIRAALEHQNADAVWLALAKSNTTPIPAKPRLAEDTQMQFAAVAG